MSSAARKVIVLCKEKLTCGLTVLSKEYPTWKTMFVTVKDTDGKVYGGLLTKEK